MPSEGVVEPPRRRFLDWRFLSALAALLFVVLIVVGSWRNWEARERDDAERAALISQLEVRAGEVEGLQRQARHLQRDMNRERRAAREAARDASGERRLLIERQEFLIRVLQRHGLMPRDTPTASRPPGGGGPASSPAAPPPASPGPPGASAGPTSSSAGSDRPGNAPDHSHAGGNGNGNGRGPGGKGRKP